MLYFDKTLLVIFFCTLLYHFRYFSFNVYLFVIRIICYCCCDLIVVFLYVFVFISFVQTCQFNCKTIVRAYWRGMFTKRILTFWSISTKYNYYLSEQLPLLVRKNSILFPDDFHLQRLYPKKIISSENSTLELFFSQTILPMTILPYNNSTPLHLDRSTFNRYNHFTIDSSSRIRELFVYCLEHFQTILFFQCPFFNTFMTVNEVGKWN